MEDFIDWIAEVEEITPDGKVSIIYRCGAHEQDPVGVTVRIPEDLILTREWIAEQMEANAPAACQFWDELDREKRMRGKRRDLEAVARGVRIAGQTPIGRPGGVPENGIVEL